MYRKIILAVSGSIAVYKALSLTRLLIKNGCEVKVIMTPASTHFVTPLSFATLSKNEVGVDLIDNDTWANHVDLGLWADAMLIAPATASTLSKLAHGQSDNMLIATYLSAKCPVFIAPAMDLDMWKHPSTKRNLDLLQEYGKTIIPVGHGELASGLVGDGRMAEPEEIISFLKSASCGSQELIGKKVLITAGPTREALDPVRYISNKSTGRMGIAIAEECLSRGAEVTLVVGPTSIPIPSHPKLHIKKIISAHDMYEAVIEHYADMDIAVMAAAVADYTPKDLSTTKIKKKEGDLSIPLERTIDIAKSIGAIKKPNQINVGFALETNDELQNAERKLESKNFDFIVLNSLQDKGAGFAHNTNKVSIVHRENKVKQYDLKAKSEVASDIIDEVISLLHK